MEGNADENKKKHINNHELRIDGMMHAVRCLSIMLIQYGIIDPDGFNQTAENFVKIIKGRENHTAHHNEGVAMVMMHCLGLSADAPAPSRFTVIDGGKSQ